MLSKLLPVLFSAALLLATHGMLAPETAAAEEVEAADLDLQIDRLRHPLAEARRDAALAIAAYGEQGDAAIGALLDALDDVDVDVRRAVIPALAAVGPNSADAAAGLARSLSDADWVVRRQAGAAFGTVDASQVLPDLRAQLRSTNVPTRIAAAVAVGKIGPGAADAMPELLDALKSADWKLRGTAARAIGAIGVAAGQPGIEALATALRDRDWGVAEPVVEALARMGEGAVPVLVAALSDDAVPVRWGAARALERIGPPARAAVPALGEALGDPVMQVRWAAARALLAFGPAAAPATGRLVNALGDDAWVVRWSAARALGTSAAGEYLDDAVTALSAALADRDSRVCEAAAFALEDIGPVARAALPALAAATTHGVDDDSADRCQVIDVGPAAEKVLIDSGWTVRWASVRALGVVGNGDPSIIKSLTTATQDEQWQVRGVATLALGQFDGRRYPAAIDAIVARVDDESSGVRKAAMNSLGSAGGPAARRVLRAALNDEDNVVRDAAADALKRWE